MLATINILFLIANMYSKLACGGTTNSYDRGSTDQGSVTSVAERPSDSESQEGDGMDASGADVDRINNCELRLNYDYYEC